MLSVPEKQSIHVFGVEKIKVCAVSYILVLGEVVAELHRKAVIAEIDYNDGSSLAEVYCRLASREKKGRCSLASTTVETETIVVPQERNATKNKTSIAILKESGVGKKNREIVFQ